MNTKIAFANLLLLSLAVNVLAASRQDQQRISQIKIISRPDTLHPGRSDKDVVFRTERIIGMARADTLPNSGKLKVLRWRDAMADDFPGMVKIYRDSIIFNKDSLIKDFKLSLRPLDSLLQAEVFSMDVPPRVGYRDAPVVRYNPMPIRRLPANASTFNFNYVDRDGIASSMNIRISDVPSDQVEKITGKKPSTGSLEATDLTIFPNFSTNHLNVSFRLKNAGTARITVNDSSQKEIFSGNSQLVNGMHWVQLPLPRNGIYYLSVIQGAAGTLKKINKE